jgi:hypothetical protein
MTPKDTLQKAISIAIGNGWNWWLKGYVERDELKLWVEDDYVYWAYKDGEFAGQPLDDDESIYSIIYKHEFARALWGKADCTKCKSLYYIPAHEPHTNTDYDHIKEWQYHLQSMVIATDPIKYLEEHMPIGEEQ